MFTVRFTEYSDVTLLGRSEANSILIFIYSDQRFIVSV